MILGTNWSAVNKLLGLLCADVSWGKRKRGKGALMQAGEAELGPSVTEPGEQSEIERLILLERNDFPLEQTQDETIKRLLSRSAASTASRSNPHDRFPICISLL